MFLKMTDLKKSQAAGNLLPDVFLFLPHQVVTNKSWFSNILEVIM